MKKRIEQFREHLENKLHRMVWAATMKGSEVTIKVYRNRISCADYVTIDDGSEVLVIKSVNSKMTLFRKTPEK